MMEMEANKKPLSYYGILGVRTESSIEEIRRAYRKLAMVSSAASDFRFKEKRLRLGWTSFCSLLFLIFGLNLKY